MGADERGVAAVLFALVMMPVLGLVGAALDYGRATAARTQMQKAADATAIALVRDAAALSDAELERKGRRIFGSVFQPDDTVTTDPVTVRRDGRTIRVEATGSLRAMIPVTGDYLRIGTVAQSTWSARRIEIALVLDNTGSMDEVVGGKRKIVELRRASLNLLNTLKAAAPDADAIRVSIVPFDTMVRVDPAANRDAGWLRFPAGANRAAWTGYVEDRDQPFDAGAAPTDATRDVTLHPAAMRGDSSLAPVMPLVSASADHGALVARVGQMRASGCTNITIGAAWGLATLQGRAGVPGASTGGGVERIMILLTDGDNTQNRWVNDCSGSGNRTAIDDRTREVCRTVRGAVDRLYTIRVINGNQGLLRDCASTDPKTGERLYYDVQDAARIDGVFQEIVSAILGTRLTH
jgi:Flp pilus assembly protein TadG